MTDRQLSKYRAIWAQIRTRLRTHGLTSEQCEDYRHRLTRRALGQDKSSTEFTNAEFDQVLQVFSAELAPVDFGAQLVLQDMPEKRVSLLLARIEALSHQLGLDTAGEQAYVDSIARRMWGKPYRDLPERALQQLEGILQRQCRRRV
jgi:truncated hemoglobin YjbI